MDHGEHIASLEAKVEAHDELFRLTHHELTRLHDGLDKLREHTDRGLADLREHTHRGLAELRDHTDRGFAELRQSIEELRREQAKMNRWLIGIALTYGTALLGIMLRLAGLL
ncbi:hypothetical protein GTP41_14180 [Pseudoduganella sp. DS3]|uniref:DUF1640 domain-containing protein n=1 Tax=Pseudoduganella guangdongensis TaxID=2692179 RepID=A0A6N9HHZ5_9BURK|nr:hypothetical protein [Pseudoduganella guangdongensis]MYN03241.1 hypothetical protein [Pseudoduganella guangdongensis]